MGLGCVFGWFQAINWRFAMTKMTPAQIVGAFAAVLVYGLTTTAIVWKVPNSGNWVLGATLVSATMKSQLCV
jgi:hypothetical protein